MDKFKTIFNDTEVVQLYKVDSGFGLLNDNNTYKEFSLVYGPGEIFVLKPNSSSLIQGLKTAKLECFRFSVLNPSCDYSRLVNQAKAYLRLEETHTMLVKSNCTKNGAFEYVLSYLLSKYGESFIRANKSNLKLPFVINQKQMSNIINSHSGVIRQSSIKNTNFGVEKGYSSRSGKYYYLPEDVVNQYEF